MKSEVRKGKNRQEEEATEESVCIKLRNKSLEQRKSSGNPLCGTWFVTWDLKATLQRKWTQPMRTARQEKHYLKPRGNRLEKEAPGGELTVRR